MMQFCFSKLYLTLLDPPISDTCSMQPILCDLRNVIAALKVRNLPWHFRWLAMPPSLWWTGWPGRLMCSNFNFIIRICVMWIGVTLQINRPRWFESFLKVLVLGKKVNWTVRIQKKHQTTLNMILALFCEEWMVMRPSTVSRVQLARFRWCSWERI